MVKNNCRPLNHAEHKPSIMKLLKCLQFSLLIISIILLISACTHQKKMNKSGAERALRVLDSELIGTVAGIMQTDGWEIFSGLLTSDSMRINESPVNNLFSSVLLKIPMNFNQEYFKNGKKVCAVNYYFKKNQDSSFYLRKLIFIKPLSLELQCFCTTNNLNHSGRITLVVSGRDTTGNFLQGRIRGRVITGSKGLLQAETLHADLKLFQLFFTVDADFSHLKPGNRQMWSDFLNNSSIEVTDYSSGWYIGRFELAEKDKEKKKEFIFHFS